ncbi:hypothetical protein SAMN06264365_118179, partial [Actinoplanes regularis]
MTGPGTARQEWREFRAALGELWRELRADPQPLPVLYLDCDGCGREHQCRNARLTRVGRHGPSRGGEGPRAGGESGRFRWPVALEVLIVLEGFLELVFEDDDPAGGFQ